MRLQATLLAVSLSGVFAALSSQRPQLPPALVYYFPSSSRDEKSSSTVQSITFSEAELVLAHRFGLSRFHDLGQYDPQRISRLSGTRDTTRQLFGGSSDGVRKEVVIAISGVKDAEDFLPGRQPDFLIENAPDSASIDKMFSTFNQESSYLSGRSGGPIFLTPNQRNPLPEIYAVPKIESAPLGVTDPFVDTYGFDKTKPTHAQYILENRLLDALWYGDLHSEINLKDAFITLHLRSLDGFLSDADTSSYGSTIKQLYDRLQKLDVFDSLTIIILPPSTASSNSEVLRNELKKRREVPISIVNSPAAFAEASESIPAMGKVAGDESKAQKPLWNGCYTSEEICLTSTNRCSEHGKCTVSDYPYHNCWTCSCSATEVDLGKDNFMKIYWAGNKCQKQDISIQFHILLVLTIVMVLAIAAVIKLLFSVGNEELPGVLTAGISLKKP